MAIRGIELHPVDLPIRFTGSFRIQALPRNLIFRALSFLVPLKAEMQKKESARDPDAPGHSRQVCSHLSEQYWAEVDECLKENFAVKNLDFTTIEIQEKVARLYKEWVKLQRAFSVRKKNGGPTIFQSEEFVGLFQAQQKYIEKIFFRHVRGYSYIMIQDTLFCGVPLPEERKKRLQQIERDVFLPGNQINQPPLPLNEIRKKLLPLTCPNRGVSLNLKDLYFFLHCLRASPSGLLSRTRNLDCMQILIDAGADVNERDAYGQTPLHIQTLAGVELLLDHGADPNIQDYQGNTPLHQQIEDGSIVLALLERGANPNIQGRGKQTPLDKIFECPLGCLLSENEKSIVAALTAFGGKRSPIYMRVLRLAPAYLNAYSCHFAISFAIGFMIPQIITSDAAAEISFLALPTTLYIVFGTSRMKTTESEVKAILHIGGFLTGIFLSHSCNLLKILKST